LKTLRKPAKRLILLKNGNRTGREDHLVPFKMHNLQIKALTNARSVTARVFTKDENAQHHCQIGNIGLKLDVVIKWIEKL
jgi:hypothetical protein